MNRECRHETSLGAKAGILGVRERHDRTDCARPQSWEQRNKSGMIRVPEGRASLAPRFSAGESRTIELSPGGTTPFIDSFY